jgi:hypothetical protein
MDGQRQLVARLPPDRGELAILVDQLEVDEEARVALALGLERVLVVPAGAAEVGDRAAEVQRRGAEVGRVGGVEAERDRGAVVDRVGHVPLAQQAAQPLGLRGPDVERLRRVARADVALAHVGQLDGAAVLVEQARGTGEGDELARPPQRVLQSRWEQVLDRELGDELVEPDALALVDGAQQPVRVAEAGGGDGTHAPTVSGGASRGPAPRDRIRTSPPP